MEKHVESMVRRTLTKSVRVAMILLMGAVTVGGELQGAQAQNLLLGGRLFAYYEEPRDAGVNLLAPLQGPGVPEGATRKVRIYATYGHQMGCAGAPAIEFKGMNSQKSVKFLFPRFAGHFAHAGSAYSNDFVDGGEAAAVGHATLSVYLDGPGREGPCGTLYRVEVCFYDQYPESEGSQGPYEGNRNGIRVAPGLYEVGRKVVWDLGWIKEPKLTGEIISDRQKVDYLKMYAPRVWLHSEESYWPSSVEWSFRFLTRYWSETYGGRWWFGAKQKLDSPSSILPYFRGAYPRSTATPRLSLRDVPAYAFWHRVNPDEVDLVYFFYYPYNRGKSVMNTMFGNHVGDWEHVTVRLLSQGEVLKPSIGATASFCVSYHGLDKKYLWHDVQKVEGTDHPITYAALESHGMHLKPGRHVYKEVPRLADDCDRGTAWDTWKKLECFDYDAKKRLEPEGTWPNWLKKCTGDKNQGNTDPNSGPVWRWGNFQWGGPHFGQYRLEHGPTGPIDKPYFGTPQLD
jgi:hypothetical protein